MAEGKQKSYFDEYQMGALKLKNRIIVAPLTRDRSDMKTLVPTDLNVKYYTQRAGFGFMFTECTTVSQTGHAFPAAAGLYNEEQMEGWKRVVDSVHEKGGLIVIQLFHGGRAADSQVNFGKQIVAPSAIPIRKNNPATQKPYEVPKELSIDEIKEVIQEFRKSAELAKKAGFDGVQLHGANGYIVDEFLRDHSNQRKDEYGGSPENRCRFALEIIDQFIEVFGKDRVGIRISPTGRYNDMFDSDPLTTYTYLIKELDKREIAHLELKEAGQLDKVPEQDKHKGFPDPHDQIKDLAVAFKGLFKGTVINNDGFDKESGIQRINSGVCDLISFGKWSISNPDLPLRFKNNWELTPYDWTTFFTHDAKGYTDYLTYEEQQQQQQLKEEQKQ